MKVAADPAGVVGAAGGTARVAGATVRRAVAGKIGDVDDVSDDGDAGSVDGFGNVGADAFVSADAFVGAGGVRLTVTLKSIYPSACITPSVLRRKLW